MKIVVIEGQDLSPFLEKIAALRVSVFHEYPYLYEGTIEFEINKVLPMYLRSVNSIFVIALKEDQVVGAATGIPLTDMEAMYQQPFKENNISMKGIFCLGDLMVVKKMRGKGIGSKMYKIFEEHVRKKNVYKKIALYEIQRDKKDPKQQKNYHSLDNFWKSYGFVKHPEIHFQIPWKEVGDDKEKVHHLIFWLKDLSDSHFTFQS